MKVALFGAVRASLRALEVLADAGVDVHVFSLAPSKAARHSDYEDLAVHAKTRGLPVTPIESINAPTTLEALRAIAPDLVCVFGWSQLVHEDFLALPRLGVLGWHPAWLPNNRGRAVIPWTILQGVSETGFTIFWIDAGMDSGDIAAQVRVPVAADETAATLYAKMETAAGDALRQLLPGLRNGQLPRTPQPHDAATYCAKRDREDGRIDWTRPAVDIERLVRACGAPYPGAFTASARGEFVVHEAVVVAPGRFWGAPGQVQWIDDDGVIVQCGERTALRLRRISGVGQAAQPAQELLKMHEHLQPRAERGA